MPGRILCFQGEPMRSLYILRSGSVEVFYNEPADAPLDAEKVERLGQRLAVLRGEGELVGEMGALLSVRTATLRAGPDGAVLQSIPLTRDTLEKAIESKRSLGVSIARTLARRLSGNNDRMRELLRLARKIDGKASEHARKFYELIEQTAGVFAGAPPVKKMVDAGRATRSWSRGREAAHSPTIEPLTRRVEMDQRVRPEQITAQGDLGALIDTPPPAIREIEPDVVLFRRGDRGAEFYIVLEGEIQVELENRQIFLIEKGGIVGEMAVLLDEEIRTATVRALQKSRLLAVTREKFQAMVEERTWILLRVVRILAQRLRNSNEALVRNKKEIASALEGLFGAGPNLARDYGTFADRVKRLASSDVLEILLHELEKEHQAILSDREEFSRELAAAWETAAGSETR
ncbi:MAG: cyclic nucleotide-binding domain-containing protein [Planctomycetes bacterium]|nr:cyclic nucleotide-binding domain-containing protein [Planctomycetota bacterium]